ncbi:hypothetical protein AB3538_14795 [Acinetobacter baumannii]
MASRIVKVTNMVLVIIHFAPPKYSNAHLATIETCPFPMALSQSTRWATPSATRPSSGSTCHHVNSLHDDRADRLPCSCHLSGQRRW